MSMQACSVAVMQGDDLISTCQHMVREQSRHILSTIERLLSEAGVSFTQLDGVAFGCGPGSFTGVRLSASVAQAIAYAKDLPLFPVSTMHAIAQGVCENYRAELVCVVLNAYAGDVYFSAYQKLDHPIMQRILPEVRCLPQEVIFVDDSSCVVVGDAWDVYADILKDKFPGDVQRPANYFPHAKDIARIAKIDFEQGRFVEVQDALPVCLYREGMWANSSTRQK